MPKKTKPKKTGRIVHVGVSRLYSLGNYENCRYEVSAEVSKGQSPKETLLQLVQIVKALKPIGRPSCLNELKAARKKLLSERTAWEKEHYSSWLEQEKLYNEARRQRVAAIELMDEMGVTRTEKDAKTTWDDDVPW